MFIIFMRLFVFSYNVFVATVLIFVEVVKAPVTGCDWMVERDSSSNIARQSHAGSPAFSRCGSSFVVYQQKLLSVLFEFSFSWLVYIRAYVQYKKYLFYTRHLNT